MKEFRKIKNNVLETKDNGFVSTHSYNDLLKQLEVATPEKIVEVEECLLQASVLGVTPFDYATYFVPSIGEWAEANNI